MVPCPSTGGSNAPVTTSDTLGGVSPRPAMSFHAAGGTNASTGEGAVAGRLVLLARVELRHGDASAVDVHERVQQRRQPEAQPPSLVGHAERDDDGAGQRHAGSGL